jgi:signal transduction histidine kinase
MLHDLRDLKLFPILTAEQIEKCAAVGERIKLHDGDIVYKEGSADYPLCVVTAGRVRISSMTGGEDNLLALHEPGEFTGEISMLAGGKTFTTARAIGETEVIRISPAKLRHLIGENSPIGDMLLSAMILRSKQVGMYFNHEEKLAALGKMSAGLAHELNNPASAARRAAALMLEAVFETPIRISEVDTRNTPEQREAIKQFTHAIQEYTKQPHCLDPLEQSDREQELLDWLEAHHIPRSEELACTFSVSGLTTKTLETWSAKLGEAFTRGLFWAETVTRLSELARDIESSTGRIAELVGAMKEYTYMDQARFQEIDVHKGLESTLKIMHHKLKNGIEVRREFGVNLPKICAYAGELNQVWTNLIDNAIDAMNGRGILTIRTGLEEQRVFVEICDNGPGIPIEHQNRIFDPFFTTKAVGKGTGLGLDITYRIVTYRHGGEIRLRTREGETCFAVYLLQNPPRESEILEAVERGRL